MSGKAKKKKELDLEAREQELELLAERPWHVRHRWTIAGFLVFGLFMLVWELVAICARDGIVDINYRFFPRMSDILYYTGVMLAEPDVYIAWFTSFGRMFAGYGIAAGVGIGLGILMGYWRFVYRLFEPIVEFLRPLPPPAIIPVSFLIFGLGETNKVFVIFFACLWPILINTIDGVRDVDPVILNTAKIFKLNRMQVFKKIILPSASPFVMSGLRVALPMALILMIITEMIGQAGSGIGSFILHAQRTFAIPEMYGAVVLVGVVAYMLNWVFLTVDRRLMGWHKGLTAREEGV